MICQSCGGTGDNFDHQRNEWGLGSCSDCSGTGDGERMERARECGRRVAACGIWQWKTGYQALGLGIVFAMTETTLLVVSSGRQIVEVESVNAVPDLTHELTAFDAATNVQPYYDWSVDPEDIATAYECRQRAYEVELAKELADRKRREDRREKIRKEGGKPLSTWKEEKNGKKA